MKKTLLFLLLIAGIKAQAQNDTFTADPAKARFVTSDIRNFWIAFDSIGKSPVNPFINYIKKGSPGLRAFIPYRIISADSLLAMVIRRKSDYEKNRNIAPGIKQEERAVRPYLYKLKELYPKAKFAPVYFVVGRFNSGGTSAKEGQIIGTEMLGDLKGLPNLIIHESIHFHQHFPQSSTLLSQCLLEGTATFIASLITGDPLEANKEQYVNAHKDLLYKEFVARMDKEDTDDWLYGTTKKDDRPNDLGYWLGAKIAEAYYNKTPDKKAAIDQMLNIKDYQQFLRQSGYLDAYLK